MELLSHYLYYSAAAPPGLRFPDPGEVLLRQLSESHIRVHLHRKQVLKPVHFCWNLKYLTKLIISGFLTYTEIFMKEFTNLIRPMISAKKIKIKDEKIIKAKHYDK